jgi:hypothetical protein
MAWHFSSPDAWSALSPLDRENGGKLSSNQCEINNEHFFVLGLIEIPVIGRDERFVWGAWVSLSKSNYERACELWQDPGRVNESGYFGWLCNAIPGYPETLYLKAEVHSRDVGVRPFIELEPTKHPLALEQANGITFARVTEIAEQMHHGRGER